jgi:hypothetical protein
MRFAVLLHAVNNPPPRQAGAEGSHSHILTAMSLPPSRTRRRRLLCWTIKNVSHGERHGRCRPAFGRSPPPLSSPATQYLVASGGQVVAGEVDSATPPPVRQFLKGEDFRTSPCGSFIKGEESGRRPRADCGPARMTTPFQCNRLQSTALHLPSVRMLARTLALLGTHGIWSAHPNPVRVSAAETRSASLRAGFTPPSTRMRRLPTREEE